jgi:hypothetical protein
MKKTRTSKSKLVHPSFPVQGAAQPSFMGSQSMMPPSSPDQEAPQMPSYTNNQMPSGEPQ